MSVVTESRYVPTMKRLMDEIMSLLPASAADVETRRELAEKLETMLDLVHMQGSALYRPQVDAMAPPSLD